MCSCARAPMSPIRSSSTWIPPQCRGRSSAIDVLARVLRSKPRLPVAGIRGRKRDALGRVAPTRQRAREFGGREGESGDRGSASHVLARDQNFHAGRLRLGIAGNAQVLRRAELLYAFGYAKNNVLKRLVDEAELDHEVQRMW